MKLKYLKKKHLVQVGLFIGLCVFSFFFIFPIYWAVTMSFKYNEDILTHPTATCVLVKVSSG